MKAIKLSVIIFLFTGNSVLIGQINPVNNLYYYQFHEFMNSNCPGFNCFKLSWQPPDNSRADTLLGYNVYKNCQFYLFTIDTAVACLGGCPCAYDDFFEGMPFWATVKAVYNSDSTESTANDSILVGEFYVSINDVKENEIKLLKNPIESGENISLLISNSVPGMYYIKLQSVKGQIIKTFTFDYSSRSIIHISTVGLHEGMYIISVEMNEKIIVKKVIIE